jgi:hypothetical protein
MHPDSCPTCKTSWNEEETIYEYFLRQYNGDKKEATKTAEAYGCTKENPKHFGKDMIGIEDPYKYDGISYWKCLKCNTLFDRWNMKEVSSDVLDD